VIEGKQLDLEPRRQSLHQRQRAGSLRELLQKDVRNDRWDGARQVVE
jgi:hypothetical protein